MDATDAVTSTGPASDPPLAPDWHTAEVDLSDDLDLFGPLDVAANLCGPTAHSPQSDDSTDIQSRICSDEIQRLLRWYSSSLQILRRTDLLSKV